MTATTPLRHRHRNPTTMRVGVNLLWLAPGRVGGSEDYLVRQLMAVADEPTSEITLYVQPGLLAAHPDLAARFDTVVGPFARDSRALRIAAEHSWLARRTRHADLVHHGGGTVPAVGNPAALATVHDLQYLAFPQYFSSARRTYLDTMMPRSMRRARVVATPSEYVRERVVDVFGRDPADVLVVPHGVPALEPPAASELDAVLARHGVRRPYLVYPAITHPHKGHRVLVDLLAVSNRVGHSLSEHQLVLIGGAGTAETALQRAITEAGVGPRVVRPGRVSAADRDALVSGADALVFPSEYEGFGAPLVEAMALGVAVVCSDHPAVVEVVGDAGVVVADRTGEAWAAGVDAARARRRALVEAGHARHTVFSAERSGRRLVEAYRRVLA